ncbi:MAG: hypothetical protein ABIH41_01380 [Nanoarchaeota archaeon]
MPEGMRDRVMMVCDFANGLSDAAIRASTGDPAGHVAHSLILERLHACQSVTQEECASGLDAENNVLYPILEALETFDDDAVTRAQDDIIMHQSASRTHHAVVHGLGELHDVVLDAQDLFRGEINHNRSMRGKHDLSEAHVKAILRDKRMRRHASVDVSASKIHDLKDKYCGDIAEFMASMDALSDDAGTSPLALLEMMDMPVQSRLHSLPALMDAMRSTVSHASRVLNSDADAQVRAAAASTHDAGLLALLYSGFVLVASALEHILVPFVDEAAKNIYRGTIGEAV